MRRLRGIGGEGAQGRPAQRAIGPAEAWLLLVIFLSNAYFYQAGGWNMNSRFDLTRALVERGTIRIDAYHGNTGDKAISGGHFYTDKAPGQSLAAVPTVALARPLLRRWGIDPGSPRGIVWLTYLSTVTSSALPGAISAGLLLVLLIRGGMSRGAARFSAVAFALCSPAWTYATLFMGHALGTALVLTTFCCALALGSPGGPRREIALAALLGAAAGGAVLTEYPAAPAVAISGALALLPALRGPERLKRLLPAMGIPASLALGGLALYHARAFGSVLETPLQHLFLFPEVRRAPFHAPRLAALKEILVGARRGLLPLAPALAAAPLGALLAWRRRSWRPGLIAGALVVTYYLLFNASFATPLAGWCYGPRYVAPILPLLAAALAPLWDRGGRPVRALLAALAAVGFALALMAVSTTPSPPDDLDHPVRELIWPAFRDGDLSLNHQSYLEPFCYPDKLRGGQLPHDAWNLGELAGLEGLWSLAPLLALHALTGIVLARSNRR
jgi:hypothetical protein